MSHQPSCRLDLGTLSYPSPCCPFLCQAEVDARLEHCSPWPSPSLLCKASPSKGGFVLFLPFSRGVCSRGSNASGMVAVQFRQVERRRHIIIELRLFAEIGRTRLDSWHREKRKLLRMLHGPCFKEI